MDEILIAKTCKKEHIGKKQKGCILLPWEMVKWFTIGSINQFEKTFEHRIMKTAWHYGCPNNVKTIQELCGAQEGNI